MSARALVMSAVLVATSARAQLAFEPAKSVTPEAEPVSALAVVLEDFDGDGDPDLVVSSVSGGGLTWHENNGGDFATGVPLRLGEGIPGVVVPVDFDRDGDLDLVFGDTRAGWLKNDGRGRFAPYLPLTPRGGTILDLRVADANGDGALDLFVFGNGAPVWYPRIPGGWLGAPQQVASSLRRTGVLADIDHDGDPDMLAPGGQRIYLYRNDGDGGFDPAGVVAETRWEILRLLSDDIDGDGDADLVFIEDSVEEIGWFENLGLAVFADAAPLATVSRSLPDVALLDLDGTAGRTSSTPQACPVP